MSKICTLEKRKNSRVFTAVQSNGRKRDMAAIRLARIISSAIISSSRVEHICQPFGTFRSIFIFISVSSRGKQ